MEKKQRKNRGKARGKQGKQAIAKVRQSHVGATASVAREVGNKRSAGDRGGRPYRQIQKNSGE